MTAAVNEILFKGRKFKFNCRVRVARKKLGSKKVEISRVEIISENRKKRNYFDLFDSSISSSLSVLMSVTHCPSPGSYVVRITSLVRTALFCYSVITVVIDCIPFTKWEEMVLGQSKIKRK